MPVHLLESAVEPRIQAYRDGHREQPMKQAQGQIPYPYVGGCEVLV